MSKKEYKSFPYKTDEDLFHRGSSEHSVEDLVVYGMAGCDYAAGPGGRLPLEDWESQIINGGPGFIGLRRMLEETYENWPVPPRIGRCRKDYNKRLALTQERVERCMLFFHWAAQWTYENKELQRCKKLFAHMGWVLANCISPKTGIVIIEPDPIEIDEIHVEIMRIRSSITGEAVFTPSKAGPAPKSILAAMKKRVKTKPKPAPVKQESVSLTPSPSSQASTTLSLRERMKRRLKK